MSASVFVVWTGQRLQNDAIEQAEHDLEIESHLVTDALHDPFQRQIEGQAITGRSLENLVQSYAKSSSARIVLVDSNLKVILSSDGNVPPGHNENNHPEFIAARAGTEQHDIRVDKRSGAERLYVAAPILGANAKPIGFVQLSEPMAPIYDAIRQTWLTLIGVAGLVVMMMALASLLLARQIARPVQNLTAVTEEIARGHLERRVGPAGPDEIQRLGRAFNLMAARVSDMLARQKEFVANAAHELRSPLTSIRLRLEILASQANGNPELTGRYLKQMDRELGYLQQLIEQLLTLSALDEKELPPRLPLDLAPLLYEVTDEIVPLAQQAQLDLEVNIPPHLPPSRVNAGQVRTILRNLLDNAIKYTPPGGHITVQAEPRNETTCISIADTGSGIPPEALPHIFDRFYRVDKSRSGRQRGSGLGLALVRAMVDANDGQIQVRSEPNVGSIFTLRFPNVKDAGHNSHIDRQGQSEYYRQG